MLRNTRIAGATFMCSACVYPQGPLFYHRIMCNISSTEPLPPHIEHGWCFAGQQLPRAVHSFSSHDDALQTKASRIFPMVLITQLPQYFTNIHSLGPTFPFLQLQKPGEKVKSKRSYSFLGSISLV